MHRALGEFGELQQVERTVDRFIAMVTFLEPTMVRVGAHLHQAAKLERERVRQPRALGQVGHAGPAQLRFRSQDLDRAAGGVKQAREDAEEGGLT
jgi:hypothetical protein